jgi:hypothetical protein
LHPFLGGENVLGDRQAYAQRGMGPSTNETMSVAGSRFGEAKMAAEMSDEDAKAMQKFNEQRANSLEALAGQAGQLAGSQGAGSQGGGVTGQV